MMAQTDIASYSFILDGNGNRTQVTQSETYASVPDMSTTNYGYNPTKNRLTSAGSNSFTYDNEGQLSSGYGAPYTFDYAHRLTGIGTATTFSYDGIGNRLQAVRNGVTTRYIYDAAGNLLAEADGNNNITKYYIYGAGLIAMATPSNSQVYCYHYNAVGSTIAITDQTQTVQNAYAYDPFGNITAQNETVPQSFKYVWQYGVMTEPNGFYYMRVRYYDQQVGRFVSEDPIGFAGGDVNVMTYVDSVGKPSAFETNAYLYTDSVGKPPTETNLYLYTGNNPVNRIDPSGYGWIGNLWTLGSNATSLSGNWSYYLGVGFGAAGTMAGGVVGGVVGAYVGSQIGSLFDPASAGQLNYNEPSYPVIRPLYTEPVYKQGPCK